MPCTCPVSFAVNGVLARRGRHTERGWRATLVLLADPEAEHLPYCHQQVQIWRCQRRWDTSFVEAAARRQPIPLRRGQIGVDRPPPIRVRS